LLASQSLNEVNKRYKCGVLSNKKIWPWIGLAHSSNEAFPATILSDNYVIAASVLDFSFFSTINWDGYIVKRQIKHPTAQFSLLELLEPIQFSKNVLPICLPESNNSNFLLNKKSNLVFFEYDKINQDFTTSISDLFTPPKCAISDPNVYCSKKLNGSSCYKTGAGVMIQEKNKWVLYGITTYAENTTTYTSCNSTLPVYSLKVPRFLNWIKSKMVKKGEGKIKLKKYKIETDCGIQTIKPNLKIVNGQQVVPYSWPWSVPILYLNVNKTLRYICTGTIISEKFILTAAHCFGYDLIDKFYISTETYDRKNISAKNTIKVKRWIIHKDYIHAFILNDIALIELEKPLKFTDKIKKACLPLSNDVTIVFNKKLYVAAWGDTSFKGELADKQLQTNLTVINFKDDLTCKNLDSQNYCTLNTESTSCNGDSGGGHFFKIRDRWYVYGITSFGLVDKDGNGCPINSPSFETMVPKYLEWIKKAMAQSFSPYEKVSLFNYV
ncbi:unnamed protein product, partial [Brachionus calyciflorus]